MTEINVLLWGCLSKWKLFCLQESKMEVCYDDVVKSLWREKDVGWDCILTRDSWWDCVIMEGGEGEVYEGVEG